MNTRKRKIIDALAEELHQKRLAIVGGVDSTEGELKVITEEQEAELEEEAQKERIATVLERLSDRDRQTLEEIDEAILRIVSGIYGKCLSCGRYIALARLRALPTTRLCIDCARAQEGRGAGGPGDEAVESPASSDLSLLDDAEIEAALHGLIRDAGNIDMGDLRVSCRDGVVELEGALPSEKQHHVLTELLQDVGGIGDVIDRLEIQKSEPEKKAGAGAESRDGRTAAPGRAAAVNYRPRRTAPPPKKNGARGRRRALEPR